MQMQPLPQPSRCVHTPAAPGTRAGTRGDTSILHPPSCPLTPGAATRGAEGVRMMVTVRVIKLPPPLPASVASRGFFAPQARKFWDFEPF